MSETAAPAVIASRKGRIGHLLLNRPKALNALDLGMIQAMSAALDEWRHDPSIHAVVVESASDRAFCAGGDIRAIRSLAQAGDAAGIAEFFGAEYRLNAAIAEFGKPYIALVDGICMGGGIGISVHGDARVTTEAGLFAMPETAIAMFPDVGATFMLPRLPGALGMYLGLTGTRLSGADAVHAGIATHFVPRARIAALAAALAHDGPAVLPAFAETLPPFTLAPVREAIDRCFSAGTVSEILTLLQAEDSDWSRETLSTLRYVSPSAVEWSFAAIRRGAGLELRPALDRELALTAHVTRHPDFAEGVRAMVVDKDRTPHWTPRTIEEVRLSDIEAMLD